MLKELPTDYLIYFTFNFRSKSYFIKSVILSILFSLLSAITIVSAFPTWLPWELQELLSLPEVGRLLSSRIPVIFSLFSISILYLFKLLAKLFMLNLLLTENVAVLAGDFFLASTLCSITLICAFSSKDSIRGGLCPFVNASCTRVACSCVSYIFPTARFSSDIYFGPLLKTQFPSIAHRSSQSVPSSKRSGSASKKTFCYVYRAYLSSSCPCFIASLTFEKSGLSLKLFWLIYVIIFYCFFIYCEPNYGKLSFW